MAATWQELWLHEDRQWVYTIYWVHDHGISTMCVQTEDTLLLAQQSTQQPAIEFSAIGWQLLSASRAGSIWVNKSQITPDALKISMICEENSTRTCTRTCVRTPISPLYRHVACRSCSCSDAVQWLYIGDHFEVLFHVVRTNVYNPCTSSSVDKQFGVGLQKYFVHYVSIADICPLCDGCNCSSRLSSITGCSSHTDI